ncbi:GLPGLI family protein [Flavobacteriaceae bacterium]|nr:GLPGLI family protein [Flavobacteriaceae bacterium]MDC0118205.1 GLPGLI family protein [bacterium]
MIRVATVFLIAITCVISESYAQDFQGVATYKTQRKLDIKMDSTQVGGMQDQIMAMLKKQFEKTYTLTFNKAHSIYKEEESLAPPSMGGSMVIVSGMGGSGELYKNTKEQYYVRQSDLFGKLFLIEDKLKETDWKLHSDTKNIGTYTCYKATTEQEQDAFKLDEADTSGKTTTTVTAWYTPQIPVSNGPDEFQGLPGLILELSYDSQTILCSKVTLNPKNKTTIKPPTNGKSVTQSEFDTIMTKKMNEMESQYNDDDDENSFKIEIGG